jgi:hypothetical protein
VWAGIADDCSVGPQILPHRLAGNHYRDFLLHDLPRQLDVVPLAEHEYGIRMSVLLHILVVLCEMFSITAIMTDG